MRSGPLTLLCTLAALAAAPRVARADEPSAPGGLGFKVAERGPGRPWVMSLTNRGEEPVRVVGDPRLLSFDVQVPGKKAKATCRVPEELFPKRADARTLVVLDPGEGIEQSFDPRLYCFSAGGQWQLVPGALVTPHYGWPEKKKKPVWKKGKKVDEAAKQEAPFVATPMPKDKADSEDEEGTKELTARPFALRSEYAEWSRTRIPSDKKSAESAPLVLKVVQGSDAEAERSATISVQLRNRSKHALTVYFRRELVSYEVMRPDGLATCDPQPDVRAPDRQGFTRLGPGGSVSVVSRLVEMCPTGTFGQPGLYLVHARFDATEAGDEWNMDGFTGRVVSDRAATIRIRTGEQPFLQKKDFSHFKVSNAKP